MTPVKRVVPIDPALVTATAGSGSAPFDALTHTPAACVVSGLYTGDLSCANNPALVGPAPGTTTIVPVVSGTVANFNITPVNGSYTILPPTNTNHPPHADDKWIDVTVNPHHDDDDDDDRHDHDEFDRRGHDGHGWEGSDHDGTTMATTTTRPTASGSMTPTTPRRSGSR